MSDTPQGPGWWRATDGRYYPPELHPRAQSQRQPREPQPAAPGPSYARQPTRRPRGRWQTWQLAVVGLAALVLGVVVGAAGSQGDGPRVVDSGGPGSTVGPGATTGATGKGSDGAVVGDKLTTSEGRSLQVYSYESPATGTNQFARAEAGKTLVAIDAEGCAGAGNLTAFEAINPVGFKLIMPDNTKIESYLGSKEPALHSAAQPKGTCSRGWVTFQAPDGAKPLFVSYEGPFQSLRWAIR